LDSQEVRVGLVQEPFVLGADKMISLVVKARRQELPNAESGFRMLFSSNPIPGFDIEIKYSRDDSGGAWYEISSSPHKLIENKIGHPGWLCPAMFHYFTNPPQRIYMRAC
jgi:hypothetical protein